MLNGSEAMLHLPPNERCLHVRTFRRDKFEIGLDVCDVGDGIKPEDMRRLFVPFFTTKKTGLGIGLAISKSIIDGHGGHLQAENNVGRGVTFHVVLPLAARSPAGLPLPSQDSHLDFAPWLESVSPSRSNSHSS
jgi:signal transduction histidine kinase